MDKQAIIQSYIGVSGSGKTWLALSHLNKYPRQIRIDAQPHGQKSLQQGCKIVRTIPELMAAVKSKKNADFKICFWPQGINLNEAFHWVCAVAITYKNIAIFADEANRYIERKLTDAQEAVFFQSRHSQTRLFYTMFNPRKISPEMRGNTLKTHMFKSAEKNVTDYLKQAGATPEFMQKFMADSLPQYSYALIETGKRPIIVSPKILKIESKGRAKIVKTPIAKTKGRRAKR